MRIIVEGLDGPGACEYAGVAMRIIAGIVSLATLQAPPGLATRPTSDRLRETLFNVLAPRIEGAGFLDLYAGSGAVGIEALSRGAAQVVFVERAAAALKVLARKPGAAGAEDGLEVRAEAWGRFCVADRPGPASTWCFSIRRTMRRTSMRRRWACWEMRTPSRSADRDPRQARAGFGAPLKGAVVIAEHRRKRSLEDRYGTLKRTRLVGAGRCGAELLFGRKLKEME